MKMKLKKGDEALVIAGSQKGKRSKVLEINSDTLKVRLQGVRVQTHFDKKEGILKKEGWIDYSNGSLCQFAGKIQNQSGKVQIRGLVQMNIIKKRFFIFFIIVAFFPFFIFAEEESFPEEENKDPEAEELWVQDTFPQYRMSFYHKSVQEQVYNDFLKEQKKERKEEEKRLG